MFLRFVTIVLLASAAVAQEKYFDSGGVQIHFVDRGQGPPVVLIHGYTGNIERHWVNTGVLQELVKDYRIIALDCRGHGHSGKPTDPQAYGVEMARDVTRLLDHLRIRKAHIVGYSMGALIVAHLLTTDADRFLSATLVATSSVRELTS